MILKAIILKAEEGGYWAEVPALPGFSRREKRGPSWTPIRAKPSPHGWPRVKEKPMRQTTTSSK